MDSLLNVCEEMEKENRNKWNIRRMDNVLEKKRKEKEEEKIERLEKEKRERWNIAKEKKEKLLKKLRNEGKLSLVGKSEQWINKRKENWRKYRETVKEIDEIEDEKEANERLRNLMMQKIPERKKLGEIEEKERKEILEK